MQCADILRGTHPNIHFVHVIVPVFKLENAEKRLHLNDVSVDRLRFIPDLYIQTEPHRGPVLPHILRFLHILQSTHSLQDIPDRAQNNFSFHAFIVLSAQKVLRFVSVPKGALPGMDVTAIWMLRRIQK